MKFGPVPLEQAEGAILAHSLALSDGPLRKGSVIDTATIARLSTEGIGTVIVARIEDDDLGEDAAAERIGQTLLADGFRLSPVFTGRVNLIADVPGVVTLDRAAVDAFNRLDEALTVATLPDMARVDEGQLVATVKIIPYGVSRRNLEEGLKVLGSASLFLHRFRGGRARLILTETPGFRAKLLDKGKSAVKDRLSSLGYSLAESVVVAHNSDAVAEKIVADVDLTLILGASATSDREDVVPKGISEAGGDVLRFGMPVDPGNLLVLARLGDMPVLGLPGCARSPALNGIDWVLERIAAGLPVTSDDIALMGVGGLLKEMPGRPQPRDGR